VEQCESKTSGICAPRERLWKGDRKGAEEFFRKSVETNAHDFIEYTTSKAMLKNMREGKL
jgi:hypothetical protein